MPVQPSGKITPVWYVLRKVLSHMHRKTRIRRFIFFGLTLAITLLIITTEDIFAQESSDVTSPVITLISPADGDVVTESELTVLFIVSSDASLKEIFINGTSIPISPDNQYSHNLVLKPGGNLISIIAIDSNDNKSTTELTVGFISDNLENLGDVIGNTIEGLGEILDLTQQLIEELGNKEIFSLTGDLSDLNEAIINGFSELTKGLNELVDIANTVSVEITNAPDIPEGLPALFDLPKIGDFNFFEETEKINEIPKGFSFATDISFKDSEEPTTVSNEDLSKPNTAVLVDANGRKFVVGFGFLEKTEEGSANLGKTFLKKNYRFQTTNAEPLKLTTTITVPADATEGNAKVSILNKNQSLATIPLKVTPTRKVKVGKKLIGKPKISEPIIAVVKKSGKKQKLSLKIKGKNFIHKIATIDGKLERLIGKASFTNVTFVPPDGIKIKSIKVNKNTVNITAEINGDIKPGTKLFNVITPKGADIGAIVIPDLLISGRLKTSATPENLLLGK